MIVHPNGERQPQELPSIKVGWDHASQNVELQFDPNEFKTWDFVEMVLSAALKKAEAAHRAQATAAMMAAHQRQTQDVALSQHISEELKRKR